MNSRFVGLLIRGSRDPATWRVQSLGEARGHATAARASLSSQDLPWRSHRSRRSSKSSGLRNSRSCCLTAQTGSKQSCFSGAGQGTARRAPSDRQQQATDSRMGEGASLPCQTGNKVHGTLLMQVYRGPISGTWKEARASQSTSGLIARLVET